MNGSPECKNPNRLVNNVVNFANESIEALEHWRETAKTTIEAALVTIQDPSTFGKPSSRYSEVEYHEIHDYLANFSRDPGHAFSSLGNITIIEDPRQVGSVVHNFVNRSQILLPHNVLSGLKLSSLMLSFFFNELGFKLFFRSRGWSSSNSHHRYFRTDYTVGEYASWKHESGYGALRHNLLKALTEKWITISSNAQYKILEELLIIEDYLSSSSSMSKVLDGASSVSKLWKIFEEVSRNNAPMINVEGRTSHLAGLSNILTTFYNSHPPFPQQPSHLPDRESSHRRTPSTESVHTVRASLAHPPKSITARQRSLYSDV
ncbi:hypothetical protein JCM3765_002265 [Sporobolomyces pararoseus]